MALATKWRPIPRLLRASATQTVVSSPGAAAPANSLPIRTSPSSESSSIATSQSTRGSSRSDPEKPSDAPDSSPDAFDLTTLPNIRRRGPIPSVVLQDDILSPKDIYTFFTQQHPDKLALVKPLLKYNNRPIRRHAAIQTRKSMGAQIYLDHQRKEAAGKEPRNPRPPVHWRSLVAMMSAATPQRKPWKGDAVRITVGPKVLEALVLGIDSSIWEIYTRTGCSLDVYPDNGFRISHYHPAASSATVVLSGDSHSTSLAISELRVLGATLAESNQRQPKSDCEVRPLTPSEAQALVLDPACRYTSAYRERPEYLPSLTGRWDIKNMIGIDVTEPTEWTDRSMLKYISQLAHAHLSQNKTFVLYDAPVVRDESRLNLMHQAFHIEEAQGTATLLAFKVAIYSALQSGPMNRPHMRSFLEEMMGLGLKPDTDVFNLFLEDTAKHKDVHKFKATLNIMASQDCEPNLQSWYHLLRLLEHEQAKRHVIRVMHTVGLLYDSRALRTVAKEMVFFDTYRALQGQSPYIEEKSTDFVHVTPSEFEASCNQNLIPDDCDAPEETPDAILPSDSTADTSTVPPLSANPKPTPLLKALKDPTTVAHPLKSLHNTDIAFKPKPFLDHLVYLYGPYWASTTAIRQIVTTMALCSRFAAIPIFLDALPPSRKKDPVIYNIIISRARTAFSWYHAHNTLNLMAQVSLQPDEIALTQLFMFARQKKWPNTQAVIWLYAAVRDLTTYTMRAAVSFDLTYPGQSLGSGWASNGPRRRFVVPPLIPWELHSEFAAITGNALKHVTPVFHDSLDLEASDDSETTSEEYKPEIERISARKLGGTFVQMVRRIINTPVPLVPQTSLLELIRVACQFDQNLTMSTDIAKSMPAPPGTTGVPVIVVPLINPTAHDWKVVKTLTIPVQNILALRIEGRKDLDKAGELARVRANKRRKNIEFF